MTSLAARLAAASKGSRELSDEMLLAVGWRIDERLHGSQWITPDGESRTWHEPRPDPTRSLDDVMAMVSKRWWKKIVDHQGEYGYASIGPTAESVKTRSPKAATPALALCIAFLAAKEQS